MKPVKRGIRYSALFTTVLTLFACDGGGGTAGDSDNSGGGNTDSGDATVLEGTWRYCLEDVQGSSESITLSFSANRFTEVSRAHSDADCVSITETLASSSGTFAIGDSVITKNGLEVDELDMRYTSGIQASQTTTLYDIFYIQNQTLYKGLATEENNLQSPTSRPDEIFFSEPYFKQ